MNRWPISANRSYEIVSGSPACYICDAPAQRFVSVQWGLGHTSDHAVCAAHLQQYRVDFDALAPQLRRLARRAMAEGAT